MATINYACIGLLVILVAAVYKMKKYSDENQELKQQLEALKKGGRCLGVPSDELVPQTREES